MKSPAPKIKAEIAGWWDRALAALTVLLCFLMAGCTFMDQLRRDKPADPSVVEQVERRSAELADLEKGAAGETLLEVGRARALLEEMSYYREAGDKAEIRRIDDKMDGVMEAIHSTATASREVQEARQLQEGERFKALQSRVKELEEEVRDLRTKLKGEQESAEISRNALIRRLEVTQASRDEAIREVVRIRARIQGMASQAEASAMFAEARVIIDRMSEEAFSEQALGDLELATYYMNAGKDALDTGNPGGAAYLFDLIPGLYEGIRAVRPREVRIRVSVAALRESPSEAGQRLGSLYLGDVVNGLDKKGDWIRVRTGAGLTGWIMRTQAQ